MSDLLEGIKSNADWIFSGIGTELIIGLVGLVISAVAFRVIKKRISGNQTVKARDNNTIYQVKKGNLTIKGSKND